MIYTGTEWLVLVNDQSKYNNIEAKGAKNYSCEKVNDMQCVNNENKCGNIQGILQHLKSKTLQKELNTDK